MLRIYNVKVIVLAVLYVAMLKGYPIHKRDEFDITQETNVEMKLPNGTIVGKYNYTDNEGNPIEVKYFADDSSYGVELKSVKTQKIFSKERQYSPEDKDSYIMMRSSSDSDKYIKPINYQKTEYRSPTSDYEVFSHKEMKAPKVCANEKVRIYLNTEKRTARKASEDASSKMMKYGNEQFDEMSKYCQQLV